MNIILTKNEKFSVFNFNNLQIRTIIIKNEVWFVANDVAKALDYIRKDGKVDTNSMTRKIANEDKMKIADDFNSSSNMSRELTIINESGLYISIFGSRKKESIQFKLWVTREVLPSIRKTGSYSISQTPENPLKQRTENLEFAGRQFDIFEKIFFRIGITKPEELAITSNRAVKNETEIDFIQLSGKVGIETLEKFFTVTELCKHIRNSSDFSESQKLSVSTKKNDKPRAENLNNILRDKGFQERIDGDWKTSEKGEKFSQFVQNKSKYSQKTIYHTVWSLEILKEVFS